MTATSTIDTSAGGRQGLTLEITGLTKRFGRVTAVDDLSFTVEPGTVTGFLGPNGSGKTTTLRMLLNLVRPTAGTATIDGQRYRDLHDPVTQVGAVLEATSFHPARRARSHLCMVARAGGIDASRVDAVLDLVGLTRDAKRRVGGFSMGMRQRLELAAAMLGDPAALILDEPSNGLDPEGIAWLRQFMRFLASEGRTVLVSSHQLAEMAQTVDRVVIISQGRLRAEGTVDELSRQMQPSMRVRTPEADRLAAVLASMGVACRRVAYDTVVIDGATPEWLGPVLAEHRVVVYELVSEGVSLEALFLSLTAGLGFGSVPVPGMPVVTAPPGGVWAPPPGYPAVPPQPGYPAPPPWAYPPAPGSAPPAPPAPPVAPAPAPAAPPAPERPEGPA